MNAILNVLLEITVYSLVLYGAILLFQKIFHKQLSAMLNYAVWALLILRLMIPVTIDSGLHLLTLPAEKIQIAQAADARNADNAMNQNLNYHMPAQQDAQTAPVATPPSTAGNSGNSIQSQPTAWKWDWQTGLVLLWGVGAIGSITFIMILWMRLQQKLKLHGTAAPVYVVKLLNDCKKDMGIKADIPVSIQDWLKSPALSCSFKPKLLLPEHMLQTLDRQQLEFGIRHELTHYKRRDHLMNLLLLALRCVYWFNPVIYFAFRRMQADMETACDARITARLDNPARQHYIQTMIDMSSKASAQYMLGMGTCRGRKSMEKRVRGIFMKNRTRPTALLTAVLLTVVMLVGCFTTACQPTPTAPVIVNQNKDLTATAVGGPAGPSHKMKDLVMPTERYKYQTANAAGSLTISVDADFIKPDSGKMPFTRVTPMAFTQEAVTGMFDYLFPSKTAKVPQTEKDIPKSEIEKFIVQINGFLSSGKNQDGSPVSKDDKARYEKNLKMWQEKFKTAPDTAPQAATTDGTLVKKTSNDGGSYYQLEAYEGHAHLMVRTGSEGGSFDNDFVIYKNTDRNFTTDNMVKINPGDALPKGAQGKLTIPLTDAMAKADGFFAAGGIKDVRLFGAYVSDDHGMGNVDNDYSAASHYAYRLYYTRTVNGTPVSCHASEATASGYTEPWMYETIIFLVADNGIISIDWQEPCKATDVIQEDTNIIDFDAAMKAFEKAVGYTYGEYEKSDEKTKVTATVQVDHIELGLVRMREKDKADQMAGLYVPAYIFYGYVREKQERKGAKPFESYKTSDGSANDFYPGPMMVIAINAMDGSVIDTMKLG